MTQTIWVLNAWGTDMDLNKFFLMLYKFFQSSSYMIFSVFNDDMQYTLDLVQIL